MIFDFCVAMFISSYAVVPGSSRRLTCYPYFRFTSFLGTPGGARCCYSKHNNYLACIGCVVCGRWRLLQPISILDCPTTLCLNYEMSIIYKTSYMSLRSRKLSPKFAINAIDLQLQ